MKKYIATVFVTQVYERIIEAESKEQAEEIALELDFIYDAYYMSSSSDEPIIEEA